MTLKELNFSKLLCVDCDNINNYSFIDYKNNNYEHKIKSYCTLCEEKGLKPCNNINYKLKYISHGAHSEDFLQALEEKENTKEWHNAGVVFVMENPSKNYDNMYVENVIKKNEKEYKKWPVEKWYWIHNELKTWKYPYNFEGRKYGDLIESVILTFKLKNAYLTNLVKCGLNDDNDNYLSTDSLSKECIDNCIENYLKKEVEILKPKVIFTFGSSTYYTVKDFFPEYNNVVGLPHPAAILKKDYFNVLYFCIMAKWLYRTKVISKEFFEEMMEKFANYEDGKN